MPPIHKEAAGRRQVPRVVIVGAGFGGLAAAQALAGAPVEVTVIDRRNYHLFQPLLYQVATAGLSPADIAWPIRGILRGQDNAAVQLGRVTGIDRERREVLIGQRRVGYDFLILATGARHAYFAHPEWEEVAPGLKKIADATHIRERILMAFERAEAEGCDAEERARLLTFVVVGGGPTGVEMAGAIAELARRALARDFRVIDPATTRIVLIEAGPRLLPAFPESLAAKAKGALESLGVEVCLGSAVSRCDAAGVAVGDARIEARNVIWAAGVMASPAAKWLGADCDRAGRVKVSADFSLPGWPEVFVIGDTAAAVDATGRVLPGVAPVAKQMGRHVADRIRARVEGVKPPAPFRYRDFGNLATIGRKAAVADFGRLQFSGFFAWLLWSLVHVYFLIGLRNRFVVALTWLWNYVTFQRGARLITGGEVEGEESGPASEITAPRGAAISRQPN
ncbi:NAD(P)/FAD-dependent oxidoreductase [Pelagibius marinus]|uniref:NAD(P)/FAD-dependent oxidoreductase n=1 Tax=Pelagibius marinus TaxID=2762760 RepID=UPI0018732852|nr:NAD(P)/FAD-dependent oxidoreductase [Pelagibius marinus]